LDRNNEDENDKTVTVTGERYRHMIQNFLIVMKNFIERSRICLKNGGGHLAENIFHS